MHRFSASFFTLTNLHRDKNVHALHVFTARRSAKSLTHPRWQVGIGVVVSVVGEDLVIDEIAPGGPAAVAGGLQLGDVLVRVDGREVRGGKPDGIQPRLHQKFLSEFLILLCLFAFLVVCHAAELLGLILGPAGSKVKIGVKRGGNPEVINVIMTRARVKK